MTWVWLAYLLCIYKEWRAVKTQLAKWGNSMAVRIPKNVAAAAKIVQTIIWSCPSKVRGQ